MTTTKTDIVCEPYFDIDVSDVLYLTDTGRRWDGERSNIRDRGNSHADEPGRRRVPDGKPALFRGA